MRIYLALLCLAALCGAVVATSLPLGKVAPTQADVDAELAARGLSPELVQDAGYIQINSNDYLFYWLVESTGNATSDPFVIWLTGGPGCSSLMAMFMENGPWTVNSQLQLTTNPYSWSNVATMVWVDQPVGTGFSYKTGGGYVANSTEMADELYGFLADLMVKYPQYAALPFYVTGESYGGHWVPSIGLKIVQENQAGSPHINLQGISIGNGWISPIIQYNYYAPFALQAGLVTKSQYTRISALYPKCAQLIDEGQYESAFSVCGNIVDEILEDAGNINPYNYKQKCEYPPLCYNMTPLTKYLNLASTRQTLGVGSHTWQACASLPYNALIGDWSHSVSTDLPTILNAGVRVLGYNGVLDLMCNYMGMEPALASVAPAGWNQTAEQPWTVNGAVAGTMRQLGGLTWLTVNNAGHMVPLDQPEVALSMITSFFTNSSYNSTVSVDPRRRVVKL